jgi:hypothetical protein
VPCLAATDASHPYAITESDFAASCLHAVMAPYTYSSGYSFGFTSAISSLYADSSTGEFVGSKTADMAATVSFNSSATPFSCSFSNWEYQIANQTPTYKSYSTSIDSGYSTALLIYPLSVSLLEKYTAVGFARRLSGGGFHVDHLRKHVSKLRLR